MRAIRERVRRVLHAVAPRAAVTITSMRARAHTQRMVKEWGLYALNQRLLAEAGDRVLAGPFAGMVLSPMTHAEHVGPWLLGTYEAELHPWLDELLRMDFAQVVDVGAKIGYYAVGLARRYPDTPVVAFDTDPWARAAVRQMAAANGTPRVEVRGFCGPEWLDAGLRGGALVISDCEGYERDLFTASRAPALDTATLLIELHDDMAPGASQAIESRFRHTHQLRRVRSHSDSAPAAPSAGTSLTPEELNRLAHEVRPPQEWVLLTPKAGDPGTIG